MRWNTEVRCALTVRSLIPSRRAICLFARPVRTSSRTSASRLVRGGAVTGASGRGGGGRAGRLGPGGEQLTAHPRVDRRLAAGDRADAVEAVLGVRVLEEVAHGP